VLQLRKLNGLLVEIYYGDRVMGGMRKLRRRAAGRQYEVEPLRRQESFPDRKMSAVLLDFAEPLLNAVDEAKAFQAIISFAALCWNLAFFPGRKQQKHLLSMVNRLAEADPPMRFELQDWARALLARKQTCFANDRRMIVGLDVVEEAGTDRLVVMSTPVND